MVVGRATITVRQAPCVSLPSIWAWECAAVNPDGASALRAFRRLPQHALSTGGTMQSNAVRLHCAKASPLPCCLGARRAETPWTAGSDLERFTSGRRSQTAPPSP